MGSLRLGPRLWQGGARYVTGAGVTARPCCSFDAAPAPPRSPPDGRYDEDTLVPDEHGPSAVVREEVSSAVAGGRPSPLEDVRRSSLEAPPPSLGAKRRGC